MEYMIIGLWLAIAIIALVIELQTAELVSAWFIIGAFVAMIVSAIFPTAYLAQVITFVVVSIASLFILRPILSKKLRLNEDNGGDNLNSLVGYKGFAETDIDKSSGHVNVNGTSWQAVSEELIKKGEKICVIEEKNLTLSVRKEE